MRNVPNFLSIYSWFGYVMYAVFNFASVTSGILFSYANIIFRKFYFCDSKEPRVIKLSLKLSILQYIHINLSSVIIVELWTFPDLRPSLVNDIWWLFPLEIDVFVSCTKDFYPREGVVSLYAAPNPFLLNKICLNQDCYLSPVHTDLTCWSIKESFYFVLMLQVFMVYRRKARSLWIVW